MSRYQTPQALRRALEDRLLALVRREGGDINRLRRQTAFDRLLCRLFREANAWLGNANAAALNPAQVEQALGGNAINAIAQKVGIPGAAATAR